MRPSIYNQHSLLLRVSFELVSWFWLVGIVSQFVLAAFRDPGIVKRNANDLDPNTGDNSKAEVALEELADEQEAGQESDRKNIPRILTERYCETCCATRPPLASHCRQCNNCVRKFDQ